MPVMLRPKKEKTTKIAYSILGKPANMQKKNNRKSQNEKLVDKQNSAFK